MAKRTYFLSTSDPDIVIVVPSVDGDITIADRNDLPEYIDALPEPHEFNLPCMLNEAALSEIADMVAESGYDIQVNYDRMAVTLHD